MKVGIIGTNWGRVHVGAFRDCGQDVAVLMGTNLASVKQIAQEDKVAKATTDASDLDSCDIIVVASPTETHLDYIRRFRDKPIFCEKPVCGVVPGIETRSLLKQANLYINYAFPFLESARVIEQLIEQGTIGSVNRVMLQVGVKFPFHKPPVPWFLNIAMHPLSFVMHLFGTFCLEHAYIGEGTANMSCALSNEGQGLDVSFYTLPTTGMKFDMSFVGDTGIAELHGGFNPERNWWFDPVKINDKPVSDGEYSNGGDIWYRANTRSVQTFLDVIKGVTPHHEAESMGLFGAEKAMDMEAVFASLMPTES